MSAHGARDDAEPCKAWSDRVRQHLVPFGAPDSLRDDATLQAHRPRRRAVYAGMLAAFAYKPGLGGAMFTSALHQITDQIHAVIAMPGGY